MVGVTEYKHRTTGLHRPWFMVDYNRSRHVPTGEIHEEIVLRIVKNWWRHPFLALVASGEVKRWIVATSKMKPGDIIRSHVDIPFIPGKTHFCVLRFLFLIRSLHLRPVSYTHFQFSHGTYIRICTHLVAYLQVFSIVT
ncbi:39S ribosomal protein L2 [Fasciolopsis buskii]|uniref:39S ribosomal protein L2 n=1 Tax=Fasciolopsis buskii TaxID=27845 RepID=A0A8E0VIF8_9TREM|nr:39S ribosomal protein L2 [Fasciolopsis buski]